MIFLLLLVRQFWVYLIIFVIFSGIVKLSYFFFYYLNMYLGSLSFSISLSYTLYFVLMLFYY